jgi:copper transport protein
MKTRLRLFGAVTVAFFVAQAAQAHTELAETVPANHATIAAAPEDVQLRFSEPVRLTALSIQKDGGAKQALGPLPAAAAETFAVALPALGDGRYVVAWRALSGDTHVMTGDFMFAVGSAANHGQHHGAEARPANEHPEHAGTVRHGDHGG